MNTKKNKILSMLHLKNTIIIIIAVVMFLPITVSAQSMASETYAIDAGRISAGVISISGAASPTYSVETAAGQELTFPTPAPTLTPDPGEGINVITTGGGGGGGGGGETPAPTLQPIPEPMPQPVFTDPDKDGDVDVFDFNILMVNWGLTETNNIADINSDGIVDIFDFNNLMVNWTTDNLIIKK